MFRHEECSSCDSSIEITISAASEGESSTQHRVEEDAQSPYVSGWTAIFCLVDDLRSHVARSAAEDFDLLVVGDAS